jgi:predicted metal-binding protein
MKTNFTVYTNFHERNIPYTVEIVEGNVSEMPISIERERFLQLCESGCPNYKKTWSCPPYSPEFEEFTAGWDKLYILHTKINLSEFADIEDNNRKIYKASSIIKSRSDNFLLKMSKRYGKYITCGSCNFCTPCKCETGEPCAHPEMMSYSYEAMGVNVASLLETFFGESLQWNTASGSPEHTSVICGLLTNEPLELSFIQEEYERFSEAFNTES